MFTIAFIDWENIEKAVKKTYGAVLEYDKFVKVIAAARVLLDLII